MFKDDVFPSDFHDILRRFNVEIIYAECNLRPHLKYFYAMQKYGNCHVITVDDDTIYKETMIEDFLKAHESNPNAILCGRCHRIQWDSNGCTLPYRKWKRDYREDIGESYELLATGVGGVFYPSSFCSRISSDLI